MASPLWPQTSCPCALHLLIPDYRPQNFLAMANKPGTISQLTGARCGPGSTWAAGEGPQHPQVFKALSSQVYVCSWERTQAGGGAGDTFQDWELGPVRAQRGLVCGRLSPLENVGVKHNPYSGPSLHNQKSGRPREPGALPTGRSPTAEGCQAPLYTNQSLSQPHLGTDLCLRLVRIAPSIGQRLLSTRAL